MELYVSSALRSVHFTLHKLCVNDGVNLRLMPEDEAPKNYQLLIKLQNGMALVFTVAMTKSAQRKFLQDRA